VCEDRKPNKPRAQCAEQIRRVRKVSLRAVSEALAKRRRRKKYANACKFRHFSEIVQKLLKMIEKHSQNPQNSLLVKAKSWLLISLNHLFIKTFSLIIF
jgi:hypothetical protein